MIVTKQGCEMLQTGTSLREVSLGEKKQKRLRMKSMSSQEKTLEKERNILNLH